VKFLVDPQLPRRMTVWLATAGHDAIHTFELPDGNRSTDKQVNEAADRAQRAVVTKDADFVDSHILRGRLGPTGLVVRG
jgi:predicted nuclease of predicted toxin-antitoxin system